MKNIELTFKDEKLLQQLFGRRRESRVNDEVQSFLDLFKKPRPKWWMPWKKRSVKRKRSSRPLSRKTEPAPRPCQSDRKIPEHLPRAERIINLPEEQREGLKQIHCDEVETLL